ncbi:ECF transporter S component [Sporolactobacillus vineae]|uniref:ECF transporter S component n=1 Tax=Sporolactobacillus vineae TaxID=444463 RepID=UPI000287A81D|nr:ECF transporter S component [Sporolactobacillus vineae]
MTKKNRTLFLTQFSILLAIEIVFCFTPLGSLPALGPIVATLSAIPVVITALLLGTGAGAAMGAFAGLFSLIIWTLIPPMPISAFVFSPFYSFGKFHGNFGSLLISFVPRILIGVVTGLVYQALSKIFPGKNVLCFSLSAALGSLTNTFGVMGGIWLFFGAQYSSLVGKAMLDIIGLTVLTSGIPEAVINAIAASAVCKPVKLILSKRRS